MASDVVAAGAFLEACVGEEDVLTGFGLASSLRTTLQRG